MFNNTFNRNRKDPLVDSIKAIMEDTHMRNQAEGLVCEAFGVLNKNALANEEVTPFELACEEIYNQLKEGVKLDELKKPTPETAFRVVDRANNRDEWSAKAANRLYSRYKKAYEPKEKKTEVKEGNDGNLANNYPPYDKVTRGDVIAGRLGKDQMGGKRKKMEEEQIDERNLLKRMKDTMRLGSSGKERVDRISGALSDRGGNWDYKKGDFTEKGKSQVKSRLKNVKGASDYALNKEETQIDEITKKTAIKAYASGAAGPWDDDHPKMDSIGDHIKRKWGKKGIEHANAAADSAVFGRKNHVGQTDRLASATPSSKMRKTRSGKIHKQDVESKKREIVYRKQMSKFEKHRKGPLPEETVFEELYINLNEKALWAIENGRLQEFVDNLTEEEFDFLDEEIVNEIDMFMGKSTGSLGSTPRMSAMNSLSSSGATGKVSTMPKAKASPSTGSKNVVSKAQLQDFQKHNPGATLGQYMNATQGKTAIGGGKNDPSSSNFKADKTQGGQKWNAPTGTTTSDKPSIGSHDFAKSSTLGQTPSAAPSTPKPTQSASDWLHKPESQGGGGLDTVKASPSLKDQADAVAKAKPVVNNDMDKAATAIKSDNGAGLGGGGGANPPSAGLSMANDPKAKSIKEEKGFVTVGNMRIKLL